MSRNGGGEVANLTLGFIIEFDNGISKKPPIIKFMIDISIYHQLNHENKEILDIEL